MKRITLNEIKLARKRIGKFIRKTPLEYSHFFSKVCKAKVYLKLENLQITGSFKPRGALNKILSLPKQQRSVLAVSAGNHGQGVAYAAKLLRKKAIIVMPKNASKTKIEGIRRFDVSLVLYGKDFDEAEEKAKQLAKERNLIFISPYNDRDVIVGQGTVALEILEDKPDINTIVVPVGGGGLISGIAIAAKSINPKIKIIGVQSTASPAMYEAIKKGKIVKIKLKPSIADGLHGNIEENSMTFNLIKKYIDKILLVSEKEIKNATKLFLEHNHQVAEGAGAVGLAALMKFKKYFKNRKVCIVISGGNIDFSLLKKVIE